MNNQNEATKFEFLLTLEGNIVVQRFFLVKDYNPNVKKSLDLYDTVTNICDDISDDLKKKTFEYLSDNLNFFHFTDGVEDEKDTSTENFLVEIKQGNDIFIQRIFPANIYHPKVRYTVDIRPSIKAILNDLTDTLSLTNEDLSWEFGGTNILNKG